MSGADIGGIQRVILASVARIDAFCQAHDLRYYLIGGGLIGAVRHGGPIPWDDDIDLGMPRPDYDRFVALARDIGLPDVVSTLDSDPDYIYAFAKCYDGDTTVKEALAVEFTRGVWVDVFPIDGTYTNRLAQRLHVGLARGLKTVFACRSGAYAPSKQGRWTLLGRRCVGALGHLLPKAALHSLLHAVLRMKPYESSEKVGNLLGRWGMREVCRREVFNAQHAFDYAGYRFMGPSGYDEYLKGVYGDYMRLPPEDRQKPDHSMVDISLQHSYLPPSATR